MDTSPSNRAAALVGVAFEIADLLLLIVAIYAKGAGVRRWNLWRSWDEVIVQPLIGRSMRFFSVAEATDALSSK